MAIWVALELVFAGIGPGGIPRDTLRAGYTQRIVRTRILAAWLTVLLLAGACSADDGDTPARPGIFDAASVAVGTTMAAVDAIMQGEAKRAFVPIAGLHHAGRDCAAGFCVFNDCGVAAEYLRAKYGVTRIAYVDIDAHHGDGVFYGFEDDPDLIFADIHEDGRYLYPGTGAVTETGRGPAGSARTASATSAASWRARASRLATMVSRQVGFFR